MSTFKDSGIIIKEYLNGESDKTLVLLLKDKGKVTVKARGARKPKSKFFSGAQLFSYCEFVIYEGNGFLTLAQIDIIKNFYTITMDYDKFCIGNYFLELVLKNTLPNEHEVNSDILYLLLKAFNSLSKDKINPILICSIFEIKYMQLDGYSPVFDGCFKCGNIIYKPSHFGVEGLICDSCLHKNILTVTIDNNIAFVINYILENNIDNIFNFKVSDDVLYSLKIVTNFFVKNNIDVVLKCDKFLENKGDFTDA